MMQSAQPLQNKRAATVGSSSAADIDSVTQLVFDPLSAGDPDKICAAWVSVLPEQTTGGKGDLMQRVAARRDPLLTLEQSVSTLNLIYDLINGLDQSQPRVPLIVAVSAENLIAPELIYLLKSRQEAYPEVAPLIYLALSGTEIGQKDTQLLEQLRYLKGLGYGLVLTELGRSMETMDLLRLVPVDLVSFDSGLLPGTLDAETLSAHWFRAILAMLKELAVPVLLPAALQAQASGGCWSCPDNRKPLDHSAFRARLTNQNAPDSAAD